MVTNLELAREFYDVLFSTGGQLSPGRLAYRVDGFQLDFYQLTPEQSREFQLDSGSPGGCGLCLRYEGALENLQGQWLRPMGPTEWGEEVGHLLDPFGFRWELKR